MENINTVITFSDGIGQGTEMQLKNTYPKYEDLIRSQIPLHQQKTADDKSLCILQIREKES